MTAYFHFLGNIFRKEGIIIIQITKNEAMALASMGFRFGSEGALHHTYSRHKKYYLTESPKNLNALKKLRAKHAVLHME